MSSSTDLGDAPDVRPARASGTQAVERALFLLRRVAEGPGEVSLAELGAASGLNRTTVWRLACALEEAGFIERDPVTKDYRLGVAATLLSARTTGQDEALIRLARPEMLELCELTAESVLLAVPRHGAAMVIAQLDSPQVVRLKPYLGSLDPLHCSSTGKVLLAAMDAGQADAVLKSELSAAGRPVSDAEAYHRELDEVRKRGYAIVVDELAEGECGISAGIEADGRVVAMLNVSGPSFRFTREAMTELAPELLARAGRIAMKISGYQADAP